MCLRPKGVPEAADQAFIGWFFWNFKMERDVYAEWSYLAGLGGGWLPKTMDRRAPASQLFGSCAAIEAATVDGGGEAVVEVVQTTE